MNYPDPQKLQHLTYTYIFYVALHVMKTASQSRPQIVACHRAF